MNEVTEGIKFYSRDSSGSSCNTPESKSLD